MRNIMRTFSTWWNTFACLLFYYYGQRTNTQASALTTLHCGRYLETNIHADIPLSD